MPDLTIAGPVGVVAIALAALFLRHISSENDKNRKQIENHLSDTVRVLAELTQIVKDLRDDIRFSR